MKNLSISFLFFSLCYLFSCAPSVDSGKVKEIDEQLNEVEKTIEAFNAVDTSLLFENYNTLVNNVRYIQKNYADTISLSTAQFLSRYYRMRKLVEDYASYDTIEEELQTSKKQMQDLKYDYVNNVLKDKKFDEYFSIERNNFFKLQEKTQSMINDWQKFQKKYAEYNPKVDSIVNSLQRKRSSLSL